MVLNSTSAQQPQISEPASISRAPNRPSHERSTHSGIRDVRSPELGPGRHCSG